MAGSDYVATSYLVIALSCQPGFVHVRLFVSCTFKVIAMLPLVFCFMAAAFFFFFGVVHCSLGTTLCSSFSKNMWELGVVFC